MTPFLISEAVTLVREVRRRQALREEESAESAESLQS